LTRFDSDLKITLGFETFVLGRGERGRMDSLLRKIREELIDKFYSGLIREKGEVSILYVHMRIYSRLYM